MSRADLLFLLALGVAAALGVAFFQHSPGYMDAEYYMAGGIRLAQGHGFSEILVWNYLDDPSGLPHPSHSYWMPLASIISALGMWLTGDTTFYAARLGFLVLAVFVPPATALLAYQLTQRRELALLSGCLAAFPPYQFPFIVTTDNFVVYNLLGCAFLGVLLGQSQRAGFFLGIFAGLLNLARTDGLLWLPLAMLAVILRALFPNPDASSEEPFFSRLRAALLPILFQIALALLGYLLIMGPWFARNLAAFGTFMAPGGSHAAWLTRYDQTFAYPASQLTFENWLASGWDTILDVRWWALTQNFGTAFAAQAGILLGPFILLALWKYRRLPVIQVACLAWLGLYLVMSLVFPFAGVRGSFFHAGAVLMPLGWALAPVGLEMLVAAARRRNWFTPQAFRVFRVMLLALNIALTLLLFNMRVIQGNWDTSDQRYAQVERELAALGAKPEDVLMVVNPPGYYIASGRASVVLPVSTEPDILLIAQKFQARYILLEEDSLPAEYMSHYRNEKPIAAFHLLYTGEGYKLYEVFTGQ